MNIYEVTYNPQRQGVTSCRTRSLLYVAAIDAAHAVDIVKNHAFRFVAPDGMEVELSTHVPFSEVPDVEGVIHMVEPCDGNCGMVHVGQNWPD